MSNIKWSEFLHHYRATVAYERETGEFIGKVYLKRLCRKEVKVAEYFGTELQEAISTTNHLLHHCYNRCVTESCL